MRSSGLITPSSPDTTMPSNCARNGKRWRCDGNVSADQLVSAYSGTSRALELVRESRPCPRARRESSRRSAGATPRSGARLSAMRGAQFGHRFGERPARVLPLVPFDGAHVGEKSLPSPRRRRRRACDTGGAGPSRAARHPGRTRPRGGARREALPPSAARPRCERRPIEHTAQQRDRLLDAFFRRSSPDPRARSTARRRSRWRPAPSTNARHHASS